MKKLLLIGALVLACTAGLAIASDTTSTATGWFMAGMAPDDYTTGLDKTIKHSGASSAYIRSKDAPKDFSTLMQIISPANYAGKRVRFSAFVKSDKVSEWAGLWMRIDGGKETLQFDNMQDRAIKGTNDWKEYSVVLDVPATATGIFYGILTSGTGTVWIDDAKLEVVPNTIMTTGAKMEQQYPTEPANLNFEN
jgi:hypothetical protein